MKLKQSTKNSSVIKWAYKALRSRKVLLRGAMLLGSLLFIVVLFLGTLGYGAYLKKNKETTYYKHVLLQIADWDFSFIKKLASGGLSDFDEIKLDIKFKHLLRLQYLREKALEEGVISSAIKDEEFPADLQYNGHRYQVKIGLTGQMPIHVADPIKWSFQVKVRGDNTINGMKRFGLLLPHTRGYLTDWMGMELMKDRGLMGLRVDFVDVSINGKPQGLYYMEEKFDKYLLESNHLREGIIFRLEKELVAYREQKLMQSSETQDQLLLLKRMWQQVMSGELEPNKFFDIPKMAKMFAITDLMNNKHALYRTNLRFYFNPITGLVEPIAREWGSLTKNRPENLSMFLEKPEVGSRHYLLEQDSILRIIYNNLEFKQHYLREAEVLSDPVVLDNIMKKNGNKLNSLMKKVYRDWPFYDLPMHVLYLNQQYFKSVLFSDIDMMSAYFNRRTEQGLSLHLKNQQDLPLEIFAVSWRDSIFFHPSDRLILEPQSPEQGKDFNFQVAESHVFADSMIPELEIYYNVLGLQSGKKNTLVFPWPFEQRLTRSQNPVMKTANFETFPFMKENKNKREICIPSGKWTINRDVIIPANQNFVLNAGAQIDLVNEARIISYSPIFSNGTSDEMVRLLSSDSSGQGLLIVNADRPSTLKYTTFEHLSRPQEDGWQLSGAVTFYESPVHISHCKFSRNHIGDDFLNIVRSEFSIDHSVFENILADAFDCDFCTGAVNNTSFVAVGNDGIDVSGTDITGSYIYMNQVGDKGLSAGEDSHLKVKWVDIRNAEIGVTSKDRSRIEISDLKLSDCRVGITLFQKKSEFGPAYASITRPSIEHSEIPFLIEEKSSLVLDGQEYKSDRTNVKDVLYGIEYGKSSK